MKVTIEFYRVREQDDAQAVLMRVARDVSDPTEAVRAAHEMARTADMPQTPDHFRIVDERGIEIASSVFSPAQKEAWREAE